MQCVTGCNSKKAEDQAKLALEISVIGALMRKADDAIQETEKNATIRAFASKIRPRWLRLSLVRG
jgi:hypothetical protein